MRKIILVLVLIGIITSCKKNEEKKETSEFFAEKITKKVTESNFGKDVFIGEYSFKENGESKIRISKKGGTYYVSTKTGKKWENPIEMKDNFDKSTCLNLKMKENLCDKIEESLMVKNKFVIMKVQKGTKIKWKTFKTGIFWFSPGLPDLHRK